MDLDCGLESITSIESSHRFKFFGRLTELIQLQSSIESCQYKLTLLYGMPGIGKTSLAQQLAKNLSSKFDRIVWISLADAPALLTTLSVIIKELSGERQAKLSQNLVVSIAKTIEYLQHQRCLLIFDRADLICRESHNVTLLADYLKFFDAFNAAEHHSFCLIVTTAKLDPIWSPYQQLELAGLDRQSCQDILESSKLIGTVINWGILVNKYQGNPQYLKIIANTIRDIFNGSIDDFLAANILIYDNIENCLSEQVDVLTNIELTLLIWLAIEGEPVERDRLIDRFNFIFLDNELFKTLDKLLGRYLIEIIGNKFGLSDLMIEYLANKYQKIIADEIWTKNLNYLHIYPILSIVNQRQVGKMQNLSFVRLIIDKLFQKSLNSQPFIVAFSSILFADRFHVNKNIKHDLIARLNELVLTLNTSRYQNICTPPEIGWIYSYAFDNINSLLSHILHQNKFTDF